MSKLSDRKIDILSPRKNKSLVSILKNYSAFHTKGIALMNEDNEGLFRTEGRKKFSTKRKEKNFLKALPMCQFYIPEKSSTIKDMEVESKVEMSNSEVKSSAPVSIADDSYKVNIVARDLLEDSSILPIEDFDSTMSSCGALGSDSSTMGSSCPEMSYLANIGTMPSRRERSEERKSSIRHPAKCQEQNMKRKRRSPLIPSQEACESASNNSSIESCPSVAKKVKFFPIITSTPTKKRLHSGMHQYRGVKKFLEYSGDYLEDDLEKNKLERNVGESGNALQFEEANFVMSPFSDKKEMSHLALINSGDGDDGNDYKNQSLSNLVEKMSSKIRFSMNNSGNVLKRKSESIDVDGTAEPPVYSTEDWSMGSGKYDAKYPAECVAMSANTRLSGTAQDQPAQHSQQYKPLKQSFDDSYKLAPIQESHRKVDDVQSKDHKPAYVLGRQRCMGFDSKIKPKTRLRRRYKSESDLFDRSIVPEGKQTVNVTSDAAQDYDEYEEGNSIVGDKPMDGADIKLYSLSDPDRSVSYDSDSVIGSGQKSIMEMFCDRMHDLQMDNT